MAMTMGMMSIGTSSSWAATAVDKATSELLIGPDWTMNIDICDSLNSNNSQVKDVVKAVKKRLQHKNPKVQLLALTLLETMVKNCGDYVHFQIAEKNLLGEMVKIVRKKTDMHVRDKILVLLDSWQEAFGGPGGKHPQYYWAYEELRRSGVQFPQRSLDTAPIFTPPVTHPTRHAQAGYGMPSNSSRTLDETMAADTEGLSFSSLDSMRNIMELLSDMLQAVNPSDCKAVKDEIIVDLVERCRSNQKKLMQMLTTTGDEELLGRGLELNDSLQTLLAKHDAIASGSPMPAQVTSSSSMSSEGLSCSSKPAEAKRDSSTGVSAKIPAPVANSTRGQIDEDEEEEDEFAQLARRHSKTQSSSASAEGTSEASRALVPVDTGYVASSTSGSSPETSNALALPDPPAPVRTTKEQDIIDLLSITLSATSTSPHPQSPRTPPVSNQNVPQTPPPLATQGYPYVPQSYLGNQGQVPYNSYVAPWAQPQPQHHFQPPPETQLQSQLQQNLHTQTQQHLRSQPYAQPQSSHEPQWQAQPVSHLQPQLQPQFQSQYSQPSAAYPPPPWAATPGYANGQNHVPATSNMFSTTRASSSSSFNPMQAARPLQHNSSFPSIGSNGSNLNDRAPVISGSTNSAPSGGQKPFIPSYRLFEDLNVFGNVDGKFKMTSSTSPSLSGTSGQGMVGGRK